MAQNSYINYRDRWFSGRQVLPSRLATSTRDWLLDPASLTHRLRRACPGGFRVRVLRQGRGVPRLDERRTLGLGERRCCVIREVRLLCHGAPWVFARTVIPSTTLTGRVRRLANLGSRPLGAVLFADPTMRREHFEVCCLKRGDELYDRATAGTSVARREIWGRRSVFLLDGKPLLVSEIFLDNPGPLDKHHPYVAMNRREL